MTIVRADWHLGDLDVAGDPASEIAVLRESANVIDLTKSHAELSDELEILLVKEGQYAARSVDEAGKPVECQLKWQPHHLLVSETGTLNCFNCPHHTEDRSQARSLVCALGREQEDIIEAIRGLSLADSLDAEMALAYGHDVAGYVEQAQAHMALAR